MSVINIRSNIRDYRVTFHSSPDFLDFGSRFQDFCCIVDETVWEIYKDTALAALPRENVVVMHFDESRKNLDTVQEIFDQLTGRDAKRNLTLISIGGGITQDVTGFAASTLYRGINWVFVPTTLLAQSDSCIGGKTSLNYRSFKNLVGTFYPPSEVHIHTPFLSTLKEEDFLSGLGEVIKLYIMGGRERFEALPNLLGPMLARDPAALLESVRESLLVKISYIEDDEFDAGKRNLLNYGHTLGHALESVTAYRIPHGQAVLIGMAFSNIIATERGNLSAARRDAVANMLAQALVTRPTKDEMAPAALIAAMRKDKKRVGSNLPLIMLNDDLSLVRINDLTEDAAVSALESLNTWLF